MITIEIGKPPVLVEEWRQHFPLHGSLNTQHSLDEYLKTAPYKIGDFLTHKYNQFVNGYNQIYLVIGIRDKIDDYVNKRYLNDPPEYLMVQSLGTYQEGLIKNGWSRFDSASMFRPLMAQEMKDYIDDNVQAKLKEWGLIA